MDREITNVLVTGAAGYIGSVLIPALLRNDFNVCMSDTYYFRSSPYFKFVNSTLDYTNFNFIPRDVRYLKASDLKNFDAIIHLAALSNDPMGEIDPYLTMEINYLASVRLAWEARKAGVKRFIFSSSCSVYGSNDDFVSETSQLNPLTAYAKSKIKAEQEIQEMVTANFSPVCMRNATVYGMSPKFRTDLAVNNLVANGYINGKLLLKSLGNAYRPFIGVNDLCKAFIQMLKARQTQIHNEVFNVGSNYENYKIADLAAVISNMLHIPVETSWDAMEDKRNYKVNFNKFQCYFPDFRFGDSVELESSVIFNTLKLNNFDNNAMLNCERLHILKELINTNELDDKLYWRIQ